MAMVLIMMAMKMQLMICFDNSLIGRMQYAPKNDLNLVQLITPVKHEWKNSPNTCALDDINGHVTLDLGVSPFFALNKTSGPAPLAPLGHGEAKARGTCEPYLPQTKQTKIPLL